MNILLILGFTYPPSSSARKYIISHSLCSIMQKRKKEKKKKEKKKKRKKEKKEKKSEISWSKVKENLYRYNDFVG